MTPRRGTDRYYRESMDQRHDHHGIILKRWIIRWCPCSFVQQEPSEIEANLLSECEDYDQFPQDYIF